MTKPKPKEELRGLVWRLTRTDERPEEEPGDKVWWRSPILLGGGAIVLIVILNIIFI